MTRGALGRATRVLAGLAALPTGYNAISGDNSQRLTLEEACRIESRVRRSLRDGEALSLPQLVHKSRQRARARVTHPGKR